MTTDRDSLPDAPLDVKRLTTKRKPPARRRKKPSERQKAAWARQSEQLRKQHKEGRIGKPGNPAWVKGVAQFKGKHYIKPHKRALLKRIQHYRNELPKNNPLRESLGLVINPFAAFDALLEGLAKSTLDSNRGRIRRIRNYRKMIEAMDLEDDYDD